MASIHPTALVDPQARLAEGVSVGPYTVIGPNVEIGEGTTIGAHAVIEGHTTIGRDNRIFQFASLGADPQDKKYAGEPTRLVIGNGNTIREFTTFNTGTVQDKGVTQIGDDNWIMAYVHVAHDCVIGSHNVIANSVQFAGHVTVGDFTLIGGISGIHQFVRIGDFAMLGFQTRLSQDLPPFVVAAGNPAEAQNVHQEGPRRRGYSPERLSLLKQMYKLLYRKGLTLAASVDEITALKATPEAHADGALGDIDKMLAFLADAQRGIVR
ncbi:MAG: acyl-ACP--UDP-N-acetylglucosamine O-acyltransferase [Aquabacterium commune]|uniref:acyl-ACP--UDP-N-acetylglucosamine O-acyltransferase n=1 Tax=Aquabacterium TaxID=92793 RepID=UPI001D9A2B9B|nr:acyl-ACP--UDP-N-acetylglucosamine O-acyltransferase [Aquabacterium sp.]MBT9611317.1 acyl-ACP--UDP-N-acetylglucosamine O-acyltransferase [Aquabacterium sp.]